MTDCWMSLNYLKAQLLLFKRTPELCQWCSCIVQTWIHLLALSQDPIETIRVKCEETAHCVHTKERLELCEARVSSRSSTEEDCTEELFDFLHARDHCVRTRNADLPFCFSSSCLYADVYIVLSCRCHTSCSTTSNDPLHHKLPRAAVVCVCETAKKNCKIIRAVQFIFLLFCCKLISHTTLSVYTADLKDIF